jgi:hypothetical protein
MRYETDSTNLKKRSNIFEVLASNSRLGCGLPRNEAPVAATGEKGELGTNAKG